MWPGSINGWFHINIKIIIIIIIKVIILLTLSHRLDDGSATTVCYWFRYAAQCRIEFLQFFPSLRRNAHTHIFNRIVNFYRMPCDAGYYHQYILLHMRHNMHPHIEEIVALHSPVLLLFTLGAQFSYIENSYKFFINYSTHRSIIVLFMVTNSIHMESTFTSF